MPTYDVAVIGAGPGGYIAAIRAAQLGLKVVVIEREEVGGVCLNWGCIPSKALLRNAEVVELFHNAEKFGIAYENLQVDLSKAIDRSRQVVDRLVRGVKQLFKKHKIDLLQGTARIESSTRIIVEPGAQVVETKNVIVATGARSKDLPMLKADGQTVLTSREALALRALPKSIAIIGGGAVGVEFAYFYRCYESAVTVIELLPRLVPNEDEEVSKQLERSLGRQGINIKTGVGVQSATRTEGGTRLTLSGEGGTVDVEKVLLGVGVAPNTEGLGLEKLGVKLERGFIAINDSMRTSVPGIYAIGDVTGKMLLAHVASAQGVIAAETCAGLPLDPITYRDMPRGTYCQPQVASLGLTETQAKESGRAIKVGRFPFAASGKAIAMGNLDGFVKIVTDAETAEILGAHLIGHDVTDLLAEISITKMLEGTAREMGRAVHTHPTLSEAVMEAGLGAVGESLNY